MSTMTYSGTLTITKCWCGLAHGVPTELYEFQHQQFHHAAH